MYSNHQLYIVKAEDSLTSIANKFRISVKDIKTMNHLHSNVLYTNQMLLVPSLPADRSPEAERVTQPIIYKVQQGDSLFQIANTYQTTIESIKQLNCLYSNVLLVGQTLKIPVYSEAVITVARANIRQEPVLNGKVIIQMDRGARLQVTGIRGDWYKVKLYNERTGWVSKKVSELKVYDGSEPALSILGYYTLQEGPGLPGSYQSFVDNTANLSQLGMFLFQISQQNPTTIEKFGSFTDNEVVVLRSLAHRSNVKALAVVHNLLYENGSQEVSKQVVAEILATPQNRTAFVQSLVSLVEQYGLDGIDLDIEDVFAEDKERLALLYEQIGRVFTQKGYYFSTAIPSKTSAADPSAFAKPFDYERIGSAANQVVIMLYNEHGWPGSGPGPVVSYGRMEAVLKYATSVIPKEKILAAVAVFGFDFNLETDRSRYVTYQDAINLARKYNSNIMFDDETKTPMFSYTDESGVKHEVWFEDERSIKAKAELADQYGVKGLALWRLGMEDPNMWTMLTEDFVVRKP